MTPQNNYASVNKLLVVASVILVIVCLAMGLQGLSIRQNTGLLHVKTFSEDSIITISQHNMSAAIIGTGSTNVRLKPGSYEVTASTNKKFSNKQVTISKQQTTTLDLASARPGIPTPDDITFNGISKFTSMGLNDAQITNLRTLFFKYDPKAITITINTKSVDNGPRDPNDEEAPFTLNFTGAIDGKKFDGTVTYYFYDENDVELTLSDPDTGAQWYQKSSVQSAPNS